MSKYAKMAETVRCLNGEIVLKSKVGVSYVKSLEDRVNMLGSMLLVLLEELDADEESRRITEAFR